MNQTEVPPEAGFLRALCLLTIALILGSVCYTVWIVVRNWSHIGV